MKKVMLSNRTVIIVALATLFFLLAGPQAHAQPAATELAALGVQLWPDYDESSMLVLLTGTLAPTTVLPATVTIPLPPGADVNAVARYTTDNQLLSDVDFTIEGDQLVMTLPDTRFQVEYYSPYEVNGAERAYDFSWLSGLSVGQLSAAVQQPLAADNMTIVPEPVNVSADRGDGLQYHSLASQSVAAGEQFDILVTYTTPTGALSAPTLAVTGPVTSVDNVATVPAETGGLFDNFNPLWLLAAFGVAALVGLAWYFGRQQTAATSARTRKPTPTRAPKGQPSRPPTTAATTTPSPSPPSATAPSAAAGLPRYCHQCGEPIVAGDKFCRNCGTPLKTAV